MISDEKQKPKFTIGKKKCPFTFGKKKLAFTIKPSKKIKDVVAFHQDTDIPIKSVEDLKKIVEEPCLKACQQLFDKNIETVDSGCNGENCSDRAYIIINYDTLDARNQQIADNMVNDDTVQFIPKSDVCTRNYFNHILIEITTSPDDFVRTVESKLLNVTQNFAPQQRIIKKIDQAQIFAMHMRAQQRR